MEVNAKEFGPLNQAFLTFWRLCVGRLTRVHGGLLVMAIGLTSRDMWQASTYACMVDFRRGAAWKRIKKNNIEEVGGPGNRTQVPAFTMLVLCQLCCLRALII